MRVSCHTYIIGSDMYRNRFHIYKTKINNKINRSSVFYYLEIDKKNADKNKNDWRQVIFAVVKK